MDRQLGAMLKPFAESLAGELSQPAGVSAAALMHRLGLLPGGGPAASPPLVRGGAALAPGSPGSPGAPGAPPSLPRDIGIWQLHTAEAALAGESAVAAGPEEAAAMGGPATPRGAAESESWYERSAAARAEWDGWADVPRLDLRSTRRRVALIGESVARGFFYDPQLTPASTLAGMLDAAGVPGGAEVIDLARVGQSAQGLLELAFSCQALRPEALVLFAGNNWNLAPMVFPDGLERLLVADVLRRHGVGALKQLLDQRVGATVEATVEAALAPIARRLPMIFVIPEFNLADWRSDVDAVVPLLAGDATELWLGLHAEATAALAGGQLQQAAALAQRMIALDAGASAAGWSILARLARDAGDTAKARELFERARDAHSWDNQLQVPRIHAGVQAALRRALPAAGIQVVDLPALLAQETPGGLPGRDLFLDYCHLTSRGIQAAMAAVAERLAPILGGTATAAAELRREAPAVDPRVEAEAHLAAAIHNAHWAQSDEIVRHHCRLAAASPLVAAVMRDFLDLQVRHAPYWACSAAQSIAASGARSFNRFVQRAPRGREGRLLDADLLAAIADALAAAGAPSTAALGTLRLAERGLHAGECHDLLDAYHYPSLANRERVWEPGFFYCAYTAVSRFPLLAAADQPVRFTLTYRQRAPAALTEPAANDAPPAGALWLNGALLATLPPSAGWSTRRLVAPAHVLRPGVNWIEVRWVPHLLPSDVALDHQARQIERGLPYCLLPVFGEIHSFTASVEPPPPGAAAPVRGDSRESHPAA